MLNGPITTKEVGDIISTLVTSKSPGPDGYSGEFYKLLKDEILESITKLYNSIWEGGGYPDSGNEALIKLLFKKGKDPLIPESYRPISLINVDVKILSKIVANRLSRVMSLLIHPVQTGFIKGRSAVSNIRTVVAVLEMAKLHPMQEYALLTLDAEKAFDNLRHQWLFLVMERLGITGNILSFIKIMYSKPRARINTSGFCSDMFDIGKGTRQGCPLSPLLFDLAIEPLVRCLLYHPGLHGVWINQVEIRTALFADDIILFTTNPNNDLKVIKDLFSKFHNLTGIKINYDKSEILPLNNSVNSEWRKNSIFKIASHYITYLGIKIGKSPSSLYSLNYPPLIGKIVRELEVWRDLPISLFGRIHLYKMSGFAKLLYPMQIIPILIKTKDINMINRALKSFLWRGKRPRISDSKLWLPKSEGGMNLPNIKLYNLASLLRHTLDWFSGRSLYSNYGIESAMAYPFSIVDIIYAKNNKLPVNLKGNIIFKDTIFVWKHVRKKLNLPMHINHNSSIVGNPNFPQGQEYNVFHKWKERGLNFFGDLFHNTTFKPKTFSELQKEFGLPQSQFLYFHQITGHWKNISPISKDLFQKTFLEAFINTAGYSISDIYPRLQLLFLKPLKDTNVKEWGKDFDLPNPTEKILQGLLKIREIVTNESWRETQFKLVHRAYKSFFVPSEVIPGTQPRSQCPKCQELRPTLKHCFWSCKKISTFWNSITLYINSVKHSNIKLDPMLMLFHYQDRVTEKRSREIIYVDTWQHICFLIAKRCIIANWANTTPPTLSDFSLTLKQLYMREKLDTLLNKDSQTSNFFKRWKTYIEFTCSLGEIKTLMNEFKSTTWYSKAKSTGELGKMEVKE